MSVANHVRTLWRQAHRSLTRWILAHRVRVRHPTLICDPTVIWDYGYRDIGNIEIGQHVAIAPNTEIIMYRTSPFSSVEGRLVLEDHAIIATGCNVRAAGGTIRIGVRTGIGQHTIIVAANHQIKPGLPRLKTPWDSTRHGVFIGDNVWVGGNSVILPGASIGDNSIIAAGSVVTGTVPANELWGGVPARKIKDLEVGPTPPDLRA